MTIRKTLKYNIEMPVTDTNSRDYLGSRTVETEWTVDIQGDKVIDVDIISCDGDLDERQFDTLKEICMAMRNMPAINVELLDDIVLGDNAIFREMYLNKTLIDQTE